MYPRSERVQKNREAPSAAAAMTGPISNQCGASLPSNASAGSVVKSTAGTAMSRVWIGSR